MLFVGILVIITIFLLLFLLSMVWPPDSPWSPWWRTNGKVAEGIISLAKITKKDIIYDLGCGDGTVLIKAAMQGTRGIGVEIDPSRVFIARVRVFLHRLSSKVQIKQKDLFSEDVSEATVVIVYLIPKALHRLEKKFRKELRPGTRVVSYVYPITYFPKVADDEKLQISVYEVPKKTNTGKK